MYKFVCTCLSLFFICCWSCCFFLWCCLRVSKCINWWFHGEDNLITYSSLPCIHVHIINSNILISNNLNNNSYVHFVFTTCIFHTWNILSALSLNIESTGESIGVCLVNLLSNWLTSSSPICNSQTDQTMDNTLCW